MESVCLVIPCYNEADRLDASGIAELLANASVNLVLVNDGSTDRTAETIESLRLEHPGRIESLDLQRNVGKGESVRRGMHYANTLGADITGYVDADFATPAGEVLRLLEILVRDTHLKVLLGARWLYLGSDIRRSNARHYAGRIFATLASTILRMPIYDTQCGAKLFRVTDSLLAALDEPFLSRWAFDVELIGRLKEGMGNSAPYDQSEFRETPLETWIDVKGSKIGFVDMVRAGLELIPIASELKRLRARAG